MRSALLRAALTTTLVAAGVVTSLVVPAPATAAPVPVYGYNASAYGTTVNVGGTYTSGRSAPAALGCSTVVGQKRENSLVTAQAAGLFQASTLHNTVTTTAAAGGGVTVTARSETASVSLLGGLVSVSGLTSQASTTRRPDGSVTATDAGTSIGRLAVAGVPVIDLRVDLRIGLPGVGYLVVDEQARSARGGLAVNLLHLHVDVGNVDVIVGHTQVGYGAESGPLSGVAYAGSADLAGVVELGRIATMGLPCQGTNGGIVSNTLSQVTLPLGLGAAGVATNEAYGIRDVALDTATGRTRSTLAAASIANVLRVGLITADVQAAYAGGSTGLVDRSTFAGLTVFGSTLPLTVPANTTITPVPGVTLYLHRVLPLGRDGFEVRMIELVVGGGSNSLGLPPLLDLRLGVASVRAHSA